ncbi:GGDEF domain-containing protein [Halioxenophilus aromaticivorans]|uniref:GGDEF domain-containing protein n=1 Tax=Halioxenophilus aromaticivorans TaxID=1306992 RepID=A0AAV3U5D1_9ALTE
MQLRKWATSTANANYARAIHWLAFVICVTYAIYHWLWDIPAIGTLAAIAGVIALASTLGSFHRQAATWLYIGFFTAQLGALALTSYYYGMRGVLLVFPIVNALFFIFNNTFASVYSVVFIGLCLGAAYQSSGADILIRSIPAFALCLLFSAAYTQSLNSHNERLYFVANHDALTKIHNRRGFLAWFSRTLKQAQKNREEIALFFFDLDKFKQVNDQYGHEVGDRVLVSFSKRLIAALRSSEIITESGSIQNIGRLSGDEFVFALVGADNTSNVEAIAARMLAALDEPIVVGEATIKLSASIGVSFASDNGYAIEQLLNEADQQMYRAKRQKLTSSGMAAT